MNKSLYQFCQRKFKTLTHGKLKLSGSLARLHHDYSFGVLAGDYLHFTEKDRALLIEQVQSENGVHLFREPYPLAQSREQSAQTQRNEKTHSYAVTRDFILLNSLQPLQLNKQRLPVSPLTSLGIYLKADQIISVEHQQIVLVENLAIMANLQALNIPESLKQALWLYRGDSKEQQQTSKASQFFKYFKETHQLVYFGDLDPKGIELALTCEAHYWLTPEDSDVINLPLRGHEMKYFKQGDSIKYLKGRDNLPEKCKIAFQKMLNNQKTLQQEHMLAHNVKLGVYKL